MPSPNSSLPMNQWKVRIYRPCSTAENQYMEDETEEAPQEVETPAQPAPAIDPQPRPHLASQQDDRPIPEGG